MGIEGDRLRRTMKNRSVSANGATRRWLLAEWVTALVVGCTLSLPGAARGGYAPSPPVPAAIQVPDGNRAFLEGHGVGTQNYICLPCPNPTSPAATCPDTSGFAWILFTPEATLFSDRGKQLTTHFFSANPSENGTVRATWRHAGDSSTVWGGRAMPSSDPAFVAANAVPWLLLTAAGVQEGPTGGRTLTATTFIQRLNTAGGVAPSSGCSRAADVGAKAFVPYSADYLFYTDDRHEEGR